MQVMLDNTTAELADTRKQLSAVDAERTAAAKRSSTLLTQWEERDLARDEELSKLRWAVQSALLLGVCSGCAALVSKLAAVALVSMAAWCLTAGLAPAASASVSTIFILAYSFPSKTNAAEKQTVC
jgi:hypothetical protein